MSAIANKTERERQRQRASKKGVSGEVENKWACTDIHYCCHKRCLVCYSVHLVKCSNVHIFSSSSSFYTLSLLLQASFYFLCSSCYARTFGYDHSKTGLLRFLLPRQGSIFCCCCCCCRSTIMNAIILLVKPKPIGFIAAINNFS